MKLNEAVGFYVNPMSLADRYVECVVRPNRVSKTANLVLVDR